MNMLSASKQRPHETSCFSLPYFSCYSQECPNDSNTLVQHFRWFGSNLKRSLALVNSPIGPEFFSQLPEIRAQVRHETSYLSPSSSSTVRKERLKYSTNISGSLVHCDIPVRGSTDTIGAWSDSARCRERNRVLSEAELGSSIAYRGLA